jgi:hypothetical protein
MPTKRELADAAYERQEDQRALAMVLDAAAAPLAISTDLQAAINRVRARFLTVSPVVKSAELPGQLAIDGSVVGEPRELGAPMAEAFDVPKQCPGCGENMLLTWGGSWVPMVPNGPPMLQCAFCAQKVVVTLEGYEAVIAERKRTVGTSDAKPFNVTRTRTRGAG